MTTDANTHEIRREARDGVDHLVLTRAFDLPRSDVWRLLTDPDELNRWFGTWRGDPASGTVEARMTFEGDEAPWESFAIEACDAPQRLRVRSAGDDGWLLDLRLSDTTEGSVLDFAQETPAADLADIAAGWDYYLDRLAAVAAGRDAAQIQWESYERRMEVYRHLTAG